MIKTLIFDCWGTLFKDASEPPSFDRFASRIGHNARDREYMKLFENHLMRKRYADLSQPITSLLDALNLSYDHGLITELQDIILSSCKTQVAYPDTLGTLASLKGHYTLCMLTNTIAQCYDCLNESYNLQEQFDCIATSFATGYIKPETDIFKTVIEAAGCKSSEIVMIGDNPIDDIEPAKKLGLHTILIDRKGRHLSHPDRVVSLDQALRVIARF